MNLEERLKFVDNLIVIEDKAYIDFKNINNYVSYNTNKELYIYLQVDNIKESIKDQIKNFKWEEIDEKNYFIKKLRNDIKAYKTYKKVKDYYDGKNKNNIKPNKKEIKIYNKLQKTMQNIDIEEQILYINEKIVYISKVSSDLFNEYFKKFSSFFQAIKTKFYKRFSNLENSNNKNDFELFTEFCFFICKFNFCQLSNKLKKVWLYSLEEKKEEIDILLKINSYNNIVKYKIENNILILQTINYENKEIDIYKVKNISNYIIENIIDYLYVNYSFLIDREKDIKKK